jgi:hypothetical protein
MADGHRSRVVNSAAVAGAGEVQLWARTPTGFSFYQSFDGNQLDDNFGAALSPCDYNGDQFIDFLIGAPNMDVGSIQDAGRVFVVTGSAFGAGVSTSFFFGDVQAGDRFGAALGVGQFDGVGVPDFVIGMPDDDVGTAIDAGSVFILSNSFGIVHQLWNQDSPGIFDTAETGDHFGGGLDVSGGKSAPAQRFRRDISQLITADYDFDAPMHKLYKRRGLNGRR